MALSETEKRKNFLKKHGLKRFNSAIRTTEGGKKGKVGILENGRPRLIRFGDASMGHNYSPEARKSFKARHGKNLGLLALAKLYKSRKDKKFAKKSVKAEYSSPNYLGGKTKDKSFLKKVKEKLDSYSRG